MARATRRDEPEEPAVDTRSRDPLAPPPENPDEPEVGAVERADATLTLLSAWMTNFQSLAHMEFSRTLAAGKQILALQLLLLPLAIAFILSLCAGAGLAGYYYTQSIYLGFAAFLLAQLLILACILLYSRRLSAMLGFSETKRQAKEAISDVLESFK